MSTDPLSHDPEPTVPGRGSAGTQDGVDALATAAAWKAEGRGVAVATVISTWGSSPRPTGSQLVIDDQGRFIGSVSGGCIEGAVIREAVEVIEQGDGRVLEFGVSNEQAWEVGLACGGTVEVYVERLGD